MSTDTWICMNCLIACGVVCTRCGVRARNMGSKWRAPKKNNHKAWNQIANGDIWWDKKALARSKRVQRDLAWKDMLFWRKVRAKKK